MELFFENIRIVVDKLLASGWCKTFPSSPWMGECIDEQEKGMYT